MTAKKNQSKGTRGNGGARNRGSVRDAMTKDPIAMDASETVFAAACKMRDAGVGDVLVTQDGKLRGIVTDRDIVVRAAAENKDLNGMKLEQLCQGDVYTVDATSSVEEVARLMEEKAVRRIPVMDGGRAVGIVSLGDLSIIGRDRDVLGEISSAPTNN